MSDFENELKIGFLEEALQSIDSVEQSFLSLESDPNNKDILNRIFRLAHNLKGSSKAVGFDQMGAFTHEYETLMLKLKEGELPVLPGTINLMLRCNDYIRSMAETLKADLNASFDFSELLAEIEKAKLGQTESITAEDFQQEEVSPPSANLFESAVGASVEEKLADVNFEVPEVLTEQTADKVDSKNSVEQNIEFQTQLELAIEKVKRAATDVGKSRVRVAIEAAIDRANNKNEDSQVQADGSSVQTNEHKVVAESIKEPAKSSAQAVKQTTNVAADVKPPASSGSSAAAADESIRVSLSRLEKLQNFVGEMVILQTVLREQISETDSIVLKRTSHQLGKVVKEVQDISMSLRMVPIKGTFLKMQRIVRDTALALGKDIAIKLVGEETELDKTVLEKINDPLVHLVRNSVDHGVESNEIRLAAGKSAQGTVTLQSYHQSGKLVIEVSDDGGGLNAEKLKAHAIKKGVIKENAVLSERDCWDLIFAPGFSTKEKVTDVSGRGVGMDVVKTNIKELSGEIQILSELGKGTTFKIILPLTLAIIDGMVVQCGAERFVLPLNHVHESLKPESGQIKPSTNLGSILALRGENLPLYRLTDLLNKKTNTKMDDQIAIVIRTGQEPFCFLVDDIIGQYQVVIKQLGQELQSLKGYSGSTILGDGKPALIIEPQDLVKARGKHITNTQSEVRRVV